MNNTVKLFFIALSSIFALTISVEGFSQGSNNSDEGSLESGTISSQYNYLWESSNRYQDHRVVKAFKLNKFKDNVLDSLKALQLNIRELNSQVTSKNSDNSELGTTIETLNYQLTAAIDEKDKFSILGTTTSKSSFKSIFWVITLGLSALLLFIFFRLKSKVAVAKETRRNFTLLEEEYEDFKKRSREKEQVLARQLQDEINKGL